MLVEELWLWVRKKYNPMTRLTLKALISNMIPAWLKSPSRLYWQQRGWKQHEHWPDVVWWQIEMEQECILDKTHYESSLHETAARRLPAKAIY